jgi:hypothetical protein
MNRPSFTAGASERPHESALCEGVQIRALQGDGVEIRYWDGSRISLDGSEARFVRDAFKDCYVLIRVKLFLRANLEIHLGVRGAFPLTTKRQIDHCFRLLRAFCRGLAQNLALP